MRSEGYGSRPARKLGSVLLHEGGKLGSVLLHEGGERGRKRGEREEGQSAN